MKRKRRIAGMPAVIIAVLLLAGCEGSGENGTDMPEKAADAGGASTAAISEAAGDSGYHPIFSEEDLDASWRADAVQIIFDGDSARVEGEGASVAEGGVKIHTGGTYVLSGTLAEGRVVAEVESGEDLKLVLNGVQITSSVSAPLYIANGDAVIVLADGTANTLTDGTSYEYADSSVKEPNACLYGDDNLSFCGNGTLTVNANFNNGIGTKDELRIASGTYYVSAVNNALKGNDCILIRAGTISLTSEGDGMKSDNERETGYGIISIEGGTIDVTAADDALQAVSLLSLTGGVTTVHAGGRRINCSGETHIAEEVMQ